MASKMSIEQQRCTTTSPSKRHTQRGSEQGGHSKNTSASNHYSRRPTATTIASSSTILVKNKKCLTGKRSIPSRIFTTSQTKILISAGKSKHTFRSHALYPSSISFLRTEQENNSKGVVSIVTRKQASSTKPTPNAPSSLAICVASQSRNGKQKKKVHFAKKLVKVYQITKNA